MNSKPQVSIIMATYNRAHLILESLKSIQNQTFANWECLIIDDGCTDNTQEVIAPLLSQDSRFKCFKRNNGYKKGLPGSRNYGLDLAKGDYIVFFDDDDIAHPQNLEICVKELSKGSVSFCRYIREVFEGSFNYVFDYSKEYSFFEININDIEKILTYELLFNSCAIMWKADCFKNNYFVEDLMYAEDWELYLRIISSGFSGISINKTLFYARKHLKSNTGEFYQNNENRRASKANAIELAIKNLHCKGLFSNIMLRHFIQVSLSYKEYNLYERILGILSVSLVEKLRWKLYYIHLPFRLYLYKIYKYNFKKPLNT